MSQERLERLRKRITMRRDRYRNSGKMALAAELDTILQIVAELARV